MEKKREHRAMCVFDKLRQENNYFKDFSDSNEIERIAGEVRHQFELMDYPTPIAHILDKVGFKIYKENLSANISGVIGVSDSLIEARGCKRIMLIITVFCSYSYSHKFLSIKDNIGLSFI